MWRWRPLRLSEVVKQPWVTAPEYAGLGAGFIYIYSSGFVFKQICHTNKIWWKLSHFGSAALKNCLFRKGWLKTRCVCFGEGRFNLLMRSLFFMERRMFCLHSANLLTQSHWYWTSKARLSVGSKDGKEPLHSPLPSICKERGFTKTVGNKDKLQIISLSSVDQHLPSASRSLLFQGFLPVLKTWGCLLTRRLGKADLP